jgi:hypothetical protein
VSDLFTRQFVITEKYIDNNNLNACLSLFQFIVRKMKDSHIHQIDEFVFVRSQNFDTNWLFDNQSYSFFLKEAERKFSKKFKVAIDYGLIYVHVTSLHRVIK